MTPEELDRRIEFIVEQQAQFAAGIQRLTERQEAFQAELEVFKETANTALEVATRAAEATERLAEGQQRADARIERLALVVNELAGIVRHHVSNGHGPDGAGAEGPC